jgi:hypothetical protein
MGYGDAGRWETMTMFNGLHSQRLRAALAAALAAGGALAVAAHADDTDLESFGSCTQFTQYMRQQAMKQVGPWGLSGGGGPVYWLAGGGPLAPGVEGDALRTPAFSGTNVQEAGIDEPDMVKTDGEFVFAIAQGQLHAIDVRGETPQLRGTLDLGDAWGQQLLLHGDRLLVIANGWGGGGGGIAISPDIGRFAPWWGEPTTTLTEIDVSDPAAMQVLDTLSMDASFLSARQAGAAVRLVVRTFVNGPQLEYAASGTLEDQARATWMNRMIIAGSTSKDWLPRYTLHDQQTGRTSSRALVRCSQMTHPEEFSGLGSITVLTLDLDQGLAPVDSDAILADGDTVYASADGVYVATQQWHDPAELSADGKTPPAVTTAIHRFDTTDPRQTTYTASGEVDGYLLSQWAMSEHEGNLRVVSTDEPPWWGGEEQLSESRVTVLGEQDGALVQRGLLTGLGQGERVYAVRFIGELGYVVTFRQVDPLYVVDVSDPTAPRVRGELKIPGYSAYLHPIGEGLLLGIGRTATAEGRVLGVQASVFDVSNPDDPKAVQQLDLGQGWTESEFDHHAFLYWPATGQAVIPIENWAEDTATQTYTYTAGAVGLQVSATGISEQGRISHEIMPVDPEQAIWQAPIRRNLVVGETLYSLSDYGLEAADLATLKERAWIQFPERVYVEEPPAP